MLKSPPPSSRPPSLDFLVAALLSCGRSKHGGLSRRHPQASAFPGILCTRADTVDTQYP